MSEKLTFGKAEVEIVDDGNKQFAAILTVGENIRYQSALMETKQQAKDWGKQMAIVGGYMEDPNKPKRKPKKKVAKKKPAKKTGATSPK